MNSGRYATNGRETTARRVEAPSRYYIFTRNLFDSSNRHSMDKRMRRRTSHSTSNSRGVAIMIKSGFDCTVSQKIIHPLGRYIILKAVIKETSCVLINLYAPKSKDKEIINFFILQRKKISHDSEENIIMGGDFDCPLNPLVNKQVGILHQRKSVAACIDCLQMNSIW